MTAIERHQPAALTPREERWIDATINQLVSSKSSLVPSNLRGKPDDLRLVLTKAAENGVRSYTTALENFHAVDGRIISSAAIAVAFARRAGHELWPETYGPTECTVAGHRRERPERITRVTWTLDMAKAANLVTKSNWKSYPAQMLYARASKTWVTINCPEVLMGLDDGAYFLEDLVDAPPADAGYLTLPPEPTTPDDTVDAEIVPDPNDDWAQRWTALCRDARCDRETSRWLLSQAVGGRVDRAADVPDDMQAACEAALAKWVADMAAPFEEPADA